MKMTKKQSKPNKKRKIKVQTIKKDTRYFSNLKNFRKEFKLYMNRITGGNIPGVTILFKNVWKENDV